MLVVWEQVAVMEMAQGFLQPVLNPSVMFLEGRDPTLDVCASVTVIMEGSIPMLLEVQVRFADSRAGYPGSETEREIGACHELLAYRPPTKQQRVSSRRAWEWGQLAVFLLRSIRVTACHWRTRAVARVVRASKLVKRATCL